MQLKEIEAIPVVDRIRRDRCERETVCAEIEFQSTTSITFGGDNGSILSDGTG